MYESPITRITADIMGTLVKREEGYLVESVHKVGFDIDKEELEKALRYDRDQYEKGFNDGRLAASLKWIPVTERLPEANEQDENNFVKAYLVQDAHWMDVARWDGEYWVAWGYGTVLKNVTAWQPLPAPWEGGV